MRLISRRLSRARLVAEDGFTMLVAIATLVVVMGLTVGAYAAVNNDLPLTSNDSFQKDAYAAAQAGIQRYQYALDQNSELWTQCAPASSTWVNQAGASPLKSTAVPGSSTEKYAVELLPAAGQSTYTQCSTTAPVASMIQATGTGAGSIRIRVTGYAGTVKRTIVANLREQSFLDYEYFTNFETSDPYLQVEENYQNYGDTSIEPPDLCGSSPPTGCGSNYSAALSGAQAQCAQYRYAGRYSQNFYSDTFTRSSTYTRQTGTTGYPCDAIDFISGDAVNGPFHTNDQAMVCGTPTFGRGPADNVEFGNSTGWFEDSGCTGAPNIKGTVPSTISILPPPPSNASLKSVAGLTFTGTTCITLSATSITVAQPNSTVAQPNSTYPSCFSAGIPTQSYAYPSSGVLYVSNGACSLTYDVDNPSYTGNTGCGTVYVSGTDGPPLTIGAENDIVIDGSLLYNDTTSLLGLIANNFVRVYHPVGNQPLGTNTGGCSGSTSNATGALSNPTINAMILSLAHSFAVDQYDCGRTLGNLTVNGGIAQDFRGVVGTHSGGTVSTGYTKVYTYDDRLRYEEPPHFIDPVQGSWRIQRQTECDTPSSC